MFRCSAGIMIRPAFVSVTTFSHTVDVVVPETQLGLLLSVTSLVNRFSLNISSPVLSVQTEEKPNA